MLALQDLTAGYHRRPVLHDVTLTVEPGTVLAVIGPNGAGKSTLIKTISGVLTPLRGSVTLGGESVSGMAEAERARRAAVVPQGGYLPRSFTVAQTVLLGRTPYLGWLGRPRAADQAAVQAALRRTDLAGMADRLVGELSGGEQQRVLLARALAQDAPVLLLDEPTTFLDLGHQTAILQLVRRLAAERGLAVLVVMHDLNLAAAFADRLALLAGGVVQAAGAPGEVLTPGRIAAAFGVAVEVARAGDGAPVILPRR
jgi:iron complex transport system ATP-binding protein